MILNRLWYHNQHFLEDLVQANRLTEMERLTVGYQLGGLLHVVLGWLESPNRLRLDQMASFFHGLQAVSDKKLELARLLLHLSLDDGKK